MVYRSQHAHNGAMFRKRTIVFGLMLAVMGVAWIALAQSANTEMASRGIVKAVHTAALSSEVVAPILKVGFREGEPFEAGDVLVAFDCRRQNMELDALAAAVREVKVAVEANRHLVRNGASSRNDVAIAEARYDKAEAEWRAMRQRLAGCTIFAPWPGIVTEISVNAFETPQPNRPLMTIARSGILEVEFIVPSRQLAQLRPGARLDFLMDETGNAYPAEVIRTGGAVDPMSQTVKLFARFLGDVEDVVAGMSGSARFESGGVK